MLYVALLMFKTDFGSVLQKLYWYVFVGLVLSTSLKSYAQVSEQQVNQQADQFIQQEILRRNEQQQNRDQLRQSLGIPLPEKKQAEEIVTASGEQCFQVSEIILQGALLIESSGDKAELVQGFVGKCLGLNQINSLLELVTNYYQNKGYITSRAYVPKQDLGDGSLLLVIVEGKITAIEIDTGNLELLSFKSAFPKSNGEQLNLRDLEQGLDQLNRLRSSRFTMQLLPGKELGESKVSLQQQAAAKAFSIVLAADNHGQKSTGEKRLSITASLDNPVGLLGYLQFFTQQDTRRGNTPATKSQSLHYDLPYGYWHLDFDASYSRYASEVEGQFLNFESSGRSRSQSLRLSRVLHRNVNSSTRATATVKRREGQNFIEDTKLDASSRTLASWALGLNHQRYIAAGQWSIGVSYSRGVPWLQASSKLDGEDAPEPLFEKFEFNSSFYKSLSNIDGKTLAYSGSVRAQKSPDDLFGSEQISIGGQYTVRGYQEASYSGATGGYTRHDIIYSISQGEGMLARLFGTVSISFGGDFGRVEDGQGEWQSLQSYGIKLQSSHPKTRISAEFGRSFGASKFDNDDGKSLLFSAQHTLR